MATKWLFSLQLPVVELLVDIRLCETRLDVASLTIGPADTTIGAVVQFAGHVRVCDAGDDRPVAALWIEHYPQMTERALHSIAEAAASRWPISAVHVYHRIGQVIVGDTIVVAAVTAPHRHEAFTACTYIMDRLKTDVPLWKRRHYADGTTAWVSARAADITRRAAWEST